MSKASVDLPEPEGPHTTTSSSRVMSRLMFFRLCWRAPSIWMPGREAAGLAAGRAGSVSVPFIKNSLKIPLWSETSPFRGKKMLTYRRSQNLSCNSPLQGGASPPGPCPPAAESVAEGAGCGLKHGSAHGETPSRYAVGAAARVSAALPEVMPAISSLISRRARSR